MSSTLPLDRAILEALSYSDIFNFPLTLDELSRYLPTQSGRKDLSSALTRLQGRVGVRDGYHFLAGREEIVDLRREREAPSRRAFKLALSYGRVLASFPFIRMVGITGSLAVLNCDQTADLDFMLVTVPGRLWTARLFVVAFNRLTQSFGHTLCPNLIVSETALEWPLHDLYSARELCQMVPVSGREVYSRLLAANTWVKDYLPNAGQQPDTALSVRPGWFQRLLELLLRGRLGDRLERWEMGRKVARLSRQAGFGVETTFTADVCQGNYNHHRSRTHELLARQLAELDAHFPPSIEYIPGGVAAILNVEGK